MNLPYVAWVSRYALSPALAATFFASSPIFAQTAADSTTRRSDATNESVVALSPFTVQAESDTGYRAMGTLSGTRINTSLRDIAVSIQAITPDFLEDTGITASTELLQYTTSTEVAGGAGGNFAGNDLGSTAAVLTGDDNRRAESTATRVRGLTSASTSRALFPSVIPFDSYNLSRVEINRGANSVLFGLGSPAGIINYNVNDAMWRNANKAELRVDDWGSVRQVLDLNRVLIKDKLAVRLVGLNDETKYQQEPSFRDDRRYFATATWRPFRSTSITANFERGWIDSTLPRQDSPRDYLTHFSTTGSRFAPNNVDYRDIPANAAFIQFDSGAGGRLMLFDGPNANTASYALYQWPDNVFNRGVVNPAAVNAARRNDFRFRQYATQNGRETMATYYGDPRGFDAIQLFLVDPTVFDFFNNNIDGNASFQWGDLQAFNAAIRQEALGGNAGLELGFDSQRYRSGYVDALDGIRGNALMLDVSEGEFAYATPGNPASGLRRNPNYLRPFIGSRGSFANRSREGETLRLTGFLKHNFAERSTGWIGKLLGQQTLTAVAFRYEENRANMSGNTAFIDYDDSRALGLTDAQSRASANSLGFLWYLGDSVAGKNTTTGLNIPRYSGNVTYPDQISINYIHSPSGEIRTGTVRVHHINNEPFERMATGASLARDRLDTVAAVLQSHWWDGGVVTTYGWRRDEVEQFTSPAFPTRTDFTRIISEGRLNDTPTGVGEEDTFTYSGVLRMNKLIGKVMPRGVELDLHYGWSENYQGLAGGRSVKGGFFPAPIGETKEMGFSMNLLNDRLFFRANWFQTEQQNLVDSGVSESIDTITAQMPDSPSGGIYGLQTLAELNAVGFTMPPGVVEAFGITFSPPNADGYVNYTRGNSASDIKKAMSKGFEFETTYAITRNWRLTMNVSQIKAIESERGQNWAETVEWVKQNWFNNPAIRALRVGVGGQLDTIGGWEQRAVTGFRNVQEADGASNPNIREWRANLVTNYTFPRNTPLAGFGVGGAVRFQDRVFLGYAGKVNPADPAGSLISDVSRPIMGPTETDYDAWISYRRPLGDKMMLKLQLNVRNLFSKDELIPFRAQQAPIYEAYAAFDHYKATDYQIFRIAAPRTISLRATLEF
ncbi:MAG TPA: TonB-dependent receptor plug domain-containing protein [Opitutaceae bacterium]|nr:TonB-dependent receptor plug domain-containing protein [Opitutaceae bacterium]